MIRNKNKTNNFVQQDKSNNFDEKNNNRMRKNSPTRGASDDGEASKRPDYRKQMYEVKRHLEAMNGRDVAGTENLGNFLRNDGKVLRFVVEYDNSSAIHGERQEFVLSYFLANQEIEILPRTKARFPFRITRWYDRCYTLHLF